MLLARLLAGCDVEALDHGQARSAGSLAATTATTDIVDACVVEAALRRHDLVVSSDEADLQAIAATVSGVSKSTGPDAHVDRSPTQTATGESGSHDQHPHPSHRYQRDRRRNCPCRTRTG